MSTEGTTPTEGESSRRKFLHQFAHMNAAARFPRPFAQFAGKPNAAFQHVTFDAMGFRNAEAVGPRTDPAEVRIFVLGGSTVVDGDTDDDTLTARLEGGLRRGGLERARVFNFGVVSACFAQMSALVWSELADHDPDLIVAVGGGNDVANPWTFDPRPGHPYDAFVLEELYDSLFDAGRADSREAGLSYDALTGLLHGRLEALRAACAWRSEAWERAVVARVHAAMRRFARLALALRTPVLCVLQPTLVRKRHRVAAEGRAGSDAFLAYLDRQYARLERVCADLRASERADAPFHVRDLGGLFAEERDQIFRDAAHCVPEGRRLMAQALTAEIAAILGARRAPRAPRGASL